MRRRGSIPLLCSKPKININMGKILFAAYMAVGFCMGTLLTITDSFVVVGAICVISAVLLTGAVAMIYESRKSNKNL